MIIPQVKKHIQWLFGPLPAVYGMVSESERES